MNWDFSSQKQQQNKTTTKRAQQGENDWFVVHKIRLHDQRGKGTVESFSR